MSFEKELRKVFGIELWELKENYASQKNQENADDSLNKPVYSNDIQSNKLINIFISDDLNINFLKNILDNLFFNSKVNVYKSTSKFTQIDKNAINLHQETFILKGSGLLNIENKKYILQQLHQYADFKFT